MKLSSFSTYRFVWLRESWPRCPDPHSVQFSRSKYIMQKLHCMLMRETLVAKTVNVDNDWSMNSLETGVLGNNMIS